MARFQRFLKHELRSENDVIAILDLSGSERPPEARYFAAMPMAAPPGGRATMS